jgi:D-glycero-D-manno-heptose 1,7-bisphosphate phosphatase
MGKLGLQLRRQMNRAIFLDRDGVINRVVVTNGLPHAPLSMSEFELHQGVGEAISAMSNAGFKIIVTTNQPDVAKGDLEQAVVESIHSLISTEFQIDDVKVCFHVDENNCSCRKPKPGMLLDAADQWDLDLSKSFMIGDRWRDIEAGKSAGCRSILIENDYADLRSVKPDATVKSLSEASEFILTNLNTREGARCRI